MPTQHHFAEKPFLEDLVAWLRALQWTDDIDTVSFIELALDFQEYGAHTLPAAPMHKHVQLLASYCESTWTLCTHTRSKTHTRYEYGRRKTEVEVEEARLQREVTRSLNTGLMPSSSPCARGGGATNFAGDFYPVMGGGKAVQAPNTVTRKRAPQPTAPATCIAVPCPMIS